MGSFAKRTRLTLDPLAFSSANTRRTAGLHLTDVIRSMLQAAGIGKARDGNAWPREKLDGMALQGYLWEDAMTETLVGRVQRSDGMAIGLVDYVRLPEIACNGERAFFVDYDARTGELKTPVPMGEGYVLMSPDGGVITEERQVCTVCGKGLGGFTDQCACDFVMPDAVRLTGGLALLECKWTTASVPAWHDDPQMRSDILNSWISTKRPDWLWQTPCYLKGLGLALGREINEVIHSVMFACGDYKGSGVIYEEWVREYSAREVDDKWDAVYGQARDKEMLR